VHIAHSGSRRPPPHSHSPTACGKHAMARNLEVKTGKTKNRQPRRKGSNTDGAADIHKRPRFRQQSTVAYTHGRDRRPDTTRYCKVGSRVQLPTLTGGTDAPIPPGTAIRDYGGQSPPCASPRCATTGPLHAKTPNPQTWAKKMKPRSKRKGHRRRNITARSWEPKHRENGTVHMTEGSTTEENNVATQKKTWRQRWKKKTQDPVICQRKEEDPKKNRTIGGTGATTTVQRKAVTMPQASAAT
jgi:hypothetical protein